MFCFDLFTFVPLLSPNFLRGPIFLLQKRPRGTKNRRSVPDTIKPVSVQFNPN